MARTLNAKPVALAVLPQPPLGVVPIFPVHGEVEQCHDVPLLEPRVVEVQSRAPRLHVRDRVLVGHPHRRHVLWRSLHPQLLPAEFPKLRHNLGEPHRAGHATGDVARHEGWELRGVLGYLRDDRPLRRLGKLERHRDGDGDDHHHEDSHRAAEVFGVLLLLLLFHLRVGLNDAHGVPIDGDGLGDESLDAPGLVDLDESILRDFGHYLGVGFEAVSRFRRLGIVPLLAAFVAVATQSSLLFQLDHVVGVVVITLLLDHL
mmetsp:Transcript_15352/g.33509  ORF Transcript_15352/g.33509 Transcript_15352/m.33509 type:complete len:260 (-) Transcript_15352:73-852(-)